MTRPQVIAFLPARYGSTRLAAKPLLCETGRPLIQHTWEQAKKARTVDDVVVATDDERIVEAVRSFGGRVVITRREHRSGTDRIAEVARGDGRDLVLNVQGDEPEVDPGHIDHLVDIMRFSGAAFGTLATPVRRWEDFVDPNRVKVVLRTGGWAAYFSRSPIPQATREEFEARAGKEHSPFLRHIGLYAYTREFLHRMVAMPPSALEEIERLEQLRAVEAGFPPKVGVVRDAAPSIDTIDDYRAFVERWRAAHA